MEGDLVRLRPLEQRDAEILFSWHRDEDVTETMDIDLPVDFMSIVEMASNRSRNSIGFMIEDNGAGKTIGIVKLNNINWVDRKAEYGIMIGNMGYWSQGHGEEATRLLLSYAFDRLDLHRVYLDTYEYNNRAIRCYEKCGFKKEGCLRKGRYWRGGRHDIVIMSILQEEFGGAGD